MPDTPPADRGSGNDDEAGRGGPLLQKLAGQLTQLRRTYTDVQGVTVDLLFMAFLLENAKFGRFAYGPVSIDVRVVEDRFAHTYQRTTPDGKPHAYEESSRRFFSRLSQETVRQGARRPDELHFLLAFMRTPEGLPAEVFGELGVKPEEVEAFSRGEPPERVKPSGPERLYSPEEAAAYFGVHIQTVRNWIRSGRLPAHRLAGQRALRIKESDLQAVLDPVDSDDFV